MNIQIDSVVQPLIHLAEVLKQSGYTTCHVGKWHLGADEWYHEKQGFDYNIGGSNFGQPPSYFDPYCRENQGCIPTLKPRQEEEYLTDRDRLADETMNFTHQHKDKPFYLYLAHYAVHTSIEGRPDLVVKYQSKTPTHQKNPEYAAVVEAADQAVGRVLENLDDLGLRDNTIVIFTSDNGGLIPLTSNQPLRAGKGYPCEGGIREPVVIRWPAKIPPGVELDEPISSIDYFPTSCEAVGVDLPPDRVIDVVSLLSLLTKGKPLKREALFWHFPHYRGQDVVPYSIVRPGNWKLIKRYEGKTFELFNLKEDLSETTDLAETHPEKVKELDEMLTSWLKEVGAKLPRPLRD
ncbi:MAG: sulfatase [Candidatus Aminicenantes bacterium]|nr:sulfatase [Candidatus Aminicenantes bacterium]